MLKSKNCLKTKECRKTYISVFRRLRVKKEMKTLQGATKEFFLSYFDSFSTPNSKESTISFFQSKFNFVNR